MKIKQFYPIVLVLLLSTLLFSCNKYSSNLKTMATIIENEIRNDFFDDDKDIVLFEFTPIKYDTINENVIDEKKRLACIDMVYLYHAEMEMLGEKLEKESNDVKSYLGMGWRSLAEISQNNVEESLEEMKYSYAKMKEFAEKDSLLEIGIKKRISPKNIYSFSAYLKISSKNSEGKIDNLRDTICYYFTETFERVRL